MQSVKLLDTREGQRLETAAKMHLKRMGPLLLRVVQHSKGLAKPPEDSWLGRVDRRTDPFEVSQLAGTLALVAADNLREVEHRLRTALPPFALYSMIRSAVEAASLGLWMLDAKNEQLAASRALRIYRQNITSDEAMWKTLIQGASASHDKLMNEAHRRHDELRGIAPECFERAVKSSAIIQCVDTVHGSDGDAEFRALSGIQVWRMCSSIVHANPVSMTHLLERHPGGGIGESHTRSSRLSFVASFLSSACTRAESLINAYRARSAPRRPGRARAGGSGSS